MQRGVGHERGSQFLTYFGIMAGSADQSECAPGRPTNSGYVFM